jgi:transcriptional regulator with XRE-family HTH domain
MTKQTTDIAEEVRAAIARKRVTQIKIATALGLSQSGVSRRLSGETDFTATEMGALATILGVPVGTLYGEPVAA